MADKKGDSQARTELLGKLLLASGEKPYILRHGTGRSTKFLILIKSESAFDEFVKPKDRVKVGPYQFIALSIGKGDLPGSVPKGLLHEDGSWSSTISLYPFK